MRKTTLWFFFQTKELATSSGKKGNGRIDTFGCPEGKKRGRKDASNTNHHRAGCSEDTGRKGLHSSISDIYVLRSMFRTARPISSARVSLVERVRTCLRRRQSIFLVLDHALSVSPARTGLPSFQRDVVDVLQPWFCFTFRPAPFFFFPPMICSTYRQGEFFVDFLKTFFSFYLMYSS